MNEITHTHLGALASRKTTALLVGLFTAAILARATWNLQQELWLVIPLALLFLHLALSLLLHRRAFCRRPGMLAFHLGLLLILAGGAWGRLTYFHGYFEVTEWGQCARADFLVRRGPFYRDALKDLAFLQDEVRVVRGRDGTVEDVVSRAALLEGAREVLRTDFGYRQPLTYQGHRFYYAGERGLSLIFSYREEGKEGKPVWAVNLPTDGQGLSQEADFRLPGRGVAVQARLPAEAKAAGGGWDLSVPRDAKVELTFRDGLAQETAAFRVGGQVRLYGGVLALEDVRLYNGYIVRYDPSLSFLVGASALSVLGLIWAFVGPMLGCPERVRPRALPQRTPAGGEREKTEKPLESVVRPVVSS